MRNVLSRSDYEDLFRGQSYPVRTLGAKCELVTRGLQATAAALDYLVAKGDVVVPRTESGRRMWDRQHIDRAAECLADAEIFTPSAWQHLVEDTDPAQDIRAFREACRKAPHLPPDPAYFVRTVMPGVPGLGIYATVQYRAMTADELAAWHGLIERARGREVMA